MWGYSYYPTSDEIYHHGIIGQKWGVRRGPPYPLDGKIYGYAYTRRAEQYGKSIHHIDREMVARINAGNKGLAAKRNCIGCSSAYLLNSLFGENYKALPIKKAKDIPGGEAFTAIFRNIKQEEFDYKKRLSKELSKIPAGTTGVVVVTKHNSKMHMMNYEKTITNHTVIIDCQENAIYDINNPKDSNSLDSRYIPIGYADCSKATLSPGYKKALSKLIVEVK